MKYKSVKEMKREMEEQAEIVSSSVGLLVLLGIYFLGLLLPYFIH